MTSGAEEEGNIFCGVVVGLHETLPLHQLTLTTPTLLLCLVASGRWSRRGRRQRQQHPELPDQRQARRSPG